MLEDAPNGEETCHRLDNHNVVRWCETARLLTTLGLASTGIGTTQTHETKGPTMELPELWPHAHYIAPADFRHLIWAAK